MSPTTCAAPIVVAAHAEACALQVRWRSRGRPEGTRLRVAIGHAQSTMSCIQVPACAVLRPDQDVRSAQTSVCALPASAGRAVRSAGFRPNQVVR